LFHNPHVGKGLRNHTLNFAVFTTNPADRALPSDDPSSLYTGGAFLPDPDGTNPHRRAVQLVGIGSEAMLTLALLYLRPKSRGSIKVQNRDPLTIPLADEGFLTNPSDMEAVKKIYKTYVRNIAKELSSIDPAYQLVSPEPNVLDDDAKLEEFIRQNFDHNHHQQGSLRMAPIRNGGVVDRRGNVHGVKDLIVADASIVPFTVDGNTSSAAYLVGYTIARQLKLQEKRINTRRRKRNFESEEE
jgi:choline dehydrogenase